LRGGRHHNWDLHGRVFWRYGITGAGATARLETIGGEQHVCGLGVQFVGRTVDQHQFALVRCVTGFRGQPFTEESFDGLRSALARSRGQVDGSYDVL
jgi:hypothetical protein